MPAAILTDMACGTTEGVGTLNTKIDNETISQSLINARRSGEPVQLNCIVSESDAYAIQMLTNQNLDDSPLFWKTGLLSNNSIFCAPIAASHSQTSPANFGSRTFNALHVEAELAYRFSTGFELGKTYQEDEVFAALDRVAVAIEVLDSRLANWQGADEFLHLADNQMNGGLVIGTGIENWRSIESSSQTVNMFINDELVLADCGSHPQLDPTTLLTGFVNQACRRGYALAAGTWVTTGTWSGYPRAQAGDRVRVEFPGLGEASVDL